MRTLMGFLGSWLVSALLVLGSHGLIYGHETRDHASQWGLFPLVHFAVWVASVCVAYPIVSLFTRSIEDSTRRVLVNAAIASVLSALVTLAFGALNPDLAYYTR